MIADGGQLVVVSTSARALAQAACRAGLAACAIDAFGDADMRDHALQWRRVPLRADGSLDGDAVIEAVGVLGGAGCTVVLGSGLESQPEVVAELARRFTVAGNAAAVWRTVHDPMAWHDTARRLGIAVPDTRADAPADPHGWLRKRGASSGGWHVRTATAPSSHEAAEDGWYYQRRVPGRAHALLFVADGRRAVPVGFHRLLPAPREAPSRWAWSGAVRPCGLGGEARARAIAAASALTAALGLRGLNGIDFIDGPQGWFMLECNPRPTAALDLWDVAPMPPLMRLHLRACAGLVVDTLPELPDAAALAVVYAGHSLSCERAADAWSAACRDRPWPGTLVAAQTPVCTVHAAGRTAADSARAAMLMRNRLLRSLMTGAGAPRMPQPTGVPQDLEVAE